jgi:holo-[acyl-carrier protein] synthase
VILGTGVDIIEVERVQRALQRHSDRLLRRLFTEREVSDCWASAEHRYRRLAARFAAKEAVLKALGIGLRGVKWTDIEVVRSPLGKPEVRLSGRLARMVEEQGGLQVHLSLSHCKEYALAQVVVAK